jgi:hypothetical protein
MVKCKGCIVCEPDKVIFVIVVVIVIIVIIVIIMWCKQNSLFLRRWGWVGSCNGGQWLMAAAVAKPEVDTS